MARVILQDANNEWSFLQQNGRRGGYLLTIVYAAGVILLYFPLSIGLTFYQRWFLQKFNYPLTVTMCHMATKFAVAAFCQWLWKWWHGKPRLKLDWSTTLRRILPMGIVSGIDIAFSNWGLHFITVSLYTMTKSSCVVFILIFAIVFKLEEKSWVQVGIVLAIAGGLLMFTYQAAQFNLIGFILVLLASFCSGIRWTLAQFLMQKTDSHLKNPLDFLYNVQPWMCLTVLPFVLAFEANKGLHAWESLSFPKDSSVVWSTLFYVGLGSFIALMMELSEYLIVSQLSGLTLSIANILKEVCTLTLAIEWNGDVMSRLNFEGLLLCMGGIILHVVHKLVKTRKSFEHQSHKQIIDEASARFLADVGTTDDEEDDENGENSSTEVLFSVLHSRDR
ncbi:solute carrier family 35 member [Nesidiocoris tenuis]|uniref:Solute carrier family 35 member n=1 Tax=Nesidiocoris tenuis TaxID=355587 RepID=A0ABN7BEL3_9HEMI|nr:solute carrier family 35 member [Nesidiocoris tenuis]